LSPLPVECPLASADQIQSAVKLLLGAKKPVLLVGSQATLNANRINDLQQAVAVIGAPSFLGGMARGLMGRNHQLHIRQGRGKALKQADVVIMAGAVADFRLDYGRALSSKSKIIAVNRSSDDLKLNTDAFWKPTIAICGDPGDFLLKLSQALTAKRRGPPATWETFRAELKRNEETVESTNSAKAAAPARGHSTVSGDKTQESLVNPLAACFAVDGALHDQSILVADGGDFVATAAYTVRPRKPLGWLDPGAFGTLGVGGGFALGAKLCRPDNDVWLIWGDGSSGYSVAEFDTFKRHGLGVIAVVGNDACWTQIEREQIPMFQDNVACPLEYTPYNTVAEGYGGHGIEVKTGDTQKVAEALKEAQSIAAQGVPVLVNVHIGGTDFREGSLSV